MLCQLHEIKFPKEIERGIGWYTDLGFTSGYGLFLISSYVVRVKKYREQTGYPCNYDRLLFLNLVYSAKRIFSITNP